MCCKQSVFLSLSYIQVISYNVTDQILKCKICCIFKFLPLSYTYVYKSQMIHSYSVYCDALHCAYQCTQVHTYLSVTYHSRRSRKIIIRIFTHLGQPNNYIVMYIQCYRISTQTHCLPDKHNIIIE